MKNRLHRLLEMLASRLPAVMCLCFSLLLTSPLPAAELNDGIDRSDPDFVKASLLIMGPGDELFSCAGHACIRLACPTYKLDYCFSYESERVRDKIWTFFRGKLKMGMFAIPTEEFLKEYRASGRGVRQYALNLPPDAKQRLWKVLDEKVAEGANLPYDYIKRGCARSVLLVFLQALGAVDVRSVAWPAKYQLTRREIIADSISAYPWTRCILHAIGGTGGDVPVPNIEKVIIPHDLLEFFRQARLGDKPIVQGPGEELVRSVPRTRGGLPGFLTPLTAAFVLVAIAFANLFVRCRYLDWAFLVTPISIGVFVTFLVVFSNLPATSWNWLIVPFNLLPYVFWRWRAKWALPFGVVVLLWAVTMLSMPHRYTDPAYAVLAIGHGVFFIKVSKKQMSKIKELAK